MRTAGLVVLGVRIPAIAYALSININTANAALLDTPPGIRLPKAAAIFDYRTKNGSFATIADIQKISSISPATFANIERLITVGATNTAPQPKPSASAMGYQKVQSVESIISPATNIQPHEEAARAPATATDLAAAGAALPSLGPVTHNSHVTGLFSVWTLGSAQCHRGRWQRIHISLI